MNSIKSFYPHSTSFLFAAIAVLFSLSCNRSQIPPVVQSIEIQFHHFGNELNTFTCSYRKDLIKDGSIAIPFWFTANEQDSILQKLLAIEFFSFPDSIAQDPKILAVQPDLGPSVFRVRYKGKEKTVIWEYPFDSNNQYSQKLEVLSKLIVRIIEAKPEYKALPPARGGYE